MSHMLVWSAVERQGKWQLGRQVPGAVESGGRQVERGGEEEAPPALVAGKRRACRLRTGTALRGGAMMTRIDSRAGVVPWSLPFLYLGRGSEHQPFDPGGLRGMP